MARLRLITRGQPSEKTLEDVTYNFQELSDHRIELPADATAEQVREALRKLLRLLALQD